MISRFIICFALGCLVCVATSSCGRVKRGGERVVEGAKAVAARQVEKAFPSYDSDAADTGPNRQRFREYLGVPVTADVREIYAYGDFLGIDYQVLLAFRCHDSTVRRIVAANGMTRCATTDPGLSGAGVPWWDREKIATLIPYRRGEESVGWEYLWYDAGTGKAFYESFSL